MLKPLGDSALLIQLGDEIDPVINHRVHALNTLLRHTNGVLETVPAYCTLLVHYDSLNFSFDQIKSLIQEKIDQADESIYKTPRRL
ncbi:MAG: carboxyltransferase domain-containing protein, partial [Anaerolineales bacterium]|nr:carboxyltransferase domain-containing protein [Anaerolineales bacterium]